MRNVKSVTAAAMIAMFSLPAFAQGYAPPGYSQGYASPGYSQGYASRGPAQGFAPPGFTQNQIHTTPRIDQRQAIHQERINRAVRYGEITSYEAERLQEEQRRIRRAERRAAADGWISPEESEWIERMQDHASQNIRYAMHDGRRRR